MISGVQNLPRQRALPFEAPYDMWWQNLLRQRALPFEALYDIRGADYQGSVLFHLKHLMTSGVQNLLRQPLFHFKDLMTSGVQNLLRQRTLPFEAPYDIRGAESTKAACSSI